MDEDLLSPLRNAQGQSPDWNAMEERLTASLAARKDVTESHHPAWGRWATAATVVIAVAVTYYPSAPAPSPQPEPSSSNARDRRLPSTPIPDAAPSTTPAADKTRKTTPVSRGGATAPPQRAPLDDFMLLPGAASFPEFESGRVVRMAVPITSLPAYGFDVVPDASPGTIDADFLVGQDGIPRAIRLATYERN